jgi:hypothetical protein
MIVRVAQLTRPASHSSFFFRVQRLSSFLTTIPPSLPLPPPGVIKATTLTDHESVIEAFGATE